MTWDPKYHAAPPQFPKGSLTQTDAKSGNGNGYLLTVAQSTAASGGRVLSPVLSSSDAKDTKTDLGNQSARTVFQRTDVASAGGVCSPLVRSVPLTSLGALSGTVSETPNPEFHTECGFLDPSLALQHALGYEVWYDFNVRFVDETFEWQRLSVSGVTWGLIDSMMSRA